MNYIYIHNSKKKKAGKVKSKLREKMRLNMIRPGDRIEQQDDENLFDINRMKTKVCMLAGNY